MALLFVLAPLICIRICDLRATVTRAHDTHGHAGHAHHASAVTLTVPDTTSHDASRAPAPMEELQTMLLKLIELIVPVLMLAVARHNIRHISVQPLARRSLSLTPPRRPPKRALAF